VKSTPVGNTKNKLVIEQGEPKLAGRKIACFEVTGTTPPVHFNYP